MKNKKVLITVLIIAGSLFTVLLAVLALITVFFIRAGRSVTPSTLNIATTVGQKAVSTVTPDKFSPKKLVKVGNHIVYEEDFFERCNYKDEEKRAALSYLPAIDKQLTDDVYLCMARRGDGTLGFDFRFGFYEMLNGAIIEGTFEDATVQKGNITISMDYSRPFVSGVDAPDSQNFAPLSDIYDIVEKHCEAHEKEMFWGNAQPLDGTYVLQYGLIVPTQSYGYYYYFTVNEYSHLKVSPYNGDVYEEYYWNGVYVD